MENMQEKLQKYRQTKKRNLVYNQFKDRLKNFIMLGVGNGTRSIDDTIVNCEETELLQEKYPDIDNCTEEEGYTAEVQYNENLPSDSESENKVFKYTLWTLYTLIWITFYIIAIELKFGVVFLMFSMLFGIYFNTRTGPKAPNEISAYSVFNENCVSIDGTLKAEQFENEIRGGIGSTR